MSFLHCLKLDINVWLLIVANGMTHYIHGELLTKTYVWEFFAVWFTQVASVSSEIIFWCWCWRTERCYPCERAFCRSSPVPFLVDIFFLNFVTQNIFNASPGVRDFGRICAWTSKAFFPRWVNCKEQSYIVQALLCITNFTLYLWSLCLRLFFFFFFLLKTVYIQSTAIGSFPINPFLYFCQTALFNFYLTSDLLYLILWLASPAIIYKSSFFRPCLLSGRISAPWLFCFFP